MRELNGRHVSDVSSKLIKRSVIHVEQRNPLHLPFAHELQVVPFIPMSLFLNQFVSFMEGLGHSLVHLLQVLRKKSWEI